MGADQRAREVAGEVGFTGLTTPPQTSMDRETKRELLLCVIRLASNMLIGVLSQHSAIYATGREHLRKATWELEKAREAYHKYEES